MQECQQVALPLWKKAVRCIELDTGDQAVVIADYGSSQGKARWSPVRPSRVPTQVPGHFISFRSTSAVRENSTSRRPRSGKPSFRSGARAALRLAESSRTLGNDMP